MSKTQLTQALDILRKARDLIAKPKNWTKHVAARNARGCPVPPESPQACAWCTIGATAAADRDSESLEARQLAQSMLKESRGLSFIVDWNDDEGTVHGDVLAAFDDAIVLGNQKLAELGTV